MTERPMTAREKYQHKIEAKVCVKCSAPLTDRHKITCDECLVKVKHWGQRARAERREAGLCPHCGGEPAPKRKLCQGCLDIAGVRYQERKASGLCVTCGAKPRAAATKCKECAEKVTKRTRDWADRLIVEVMNAYGGTVCACCGETNVAFLTIDHVHGDGNRHRRSMKAEGVSSTYRWLKKNNFPPGFQVLCMNCNWAKGKYGICPHERSRREQSAEQAPG